MAVFIFVLRHLLLCTLHTHIFFSFFALACFDDKLLCVVRVVLIGTELVPQTLATLM